MHLTVLAVGRARGTPSAALTADYLRRLPWPAKVVEIREQSERPDGKRREGEALLAALPAGAFVVALDLAGKTYDSRAFATQIAGWRDRGVRELSFIVGGADGLDKSVLDRADARLSLGPMTWPHLLVRAMLAEQLYRATTLLTGHPYHR
ncbi:MAG: 23S rRNA (pseudouridine(1915)-N(3))-methyltransferase RlmH [Alphaproteobacteria bacterium]|nr:23S rRNA (pseudouridine(1915)-N(3))-methyltransferase RlmH [Alphaproteobacteria bacterium]